MAPCYIGGMELEPATDLFLSLTPEKVLAAVEAAGLRCNPVCYPLNSFENRVYEVELEDRTRLVAKFYRPGRWDERQILEEHQFLHELDEDEVLIDDFEASLGGMRVRITAVLERTCVYIDRSGERRLASKKDLVVEADKLPIRRRGIG